MLERARRHEGVRRPVGVVAWKRTGIRHHGSVDPMRRCRLRLGVQSPASSRNPASEQGLDGVPAPFSACRQGVREAWLGGAGPPGQRLFGNASKQERARQGEHRDHPNRVCSKMPRGGQQPGNIGVHEPHLFGTHRDVDHGLETAGSPNILPCLARLMGKIVACGRRRHPARCSIHFDALCAG